MRGQGIEGLSLYLNGLYASPMVFIIPFYILLSSFAAVSLFENVFWAADGYGISEGFSKVGT